MTSIIIKHVTEFDQSELGQILDSTMMEFLKKTVTSNDETGTKLANLLQINELQRKIVLELTSPWHRANMIAAWCEQFKLPQAKESIVDILKLIEQLKQSLSTKSVTNGLMAMLFFTSTELNLKKILCYLDEMESFFKSFIKIDFRNGKGYSAKYFKRYAIQSLFWMGKQMGLAETGRPTKLNEYIHIVTERVYTEINSDYHKYKQIDFLKTIEQNMNTPLLFIYDPYRKKTNDILSAINKHSRSIA